MDTRLWAREHSKEQPNRPCSPLTGDGSKGERGRWNGRTNGPSVNRTLVSPSARKFSLPSRSFPHVERKSRQIRSLLTTLATVKIILPAPLSQDNSPPDNPTEMESVPVIGYLQRPSVHPVGSAAWTPPSAGRHILRLRCRPARRSRLRNSWKVRGLPSLARQEDG